MPATSAVSVQNTPTALPVTVLTRKQQVICNQGASSIYLNTNSSFGGGAGIEVLPSTTLTLNTGVPLWANAIVAQAGGLNDQTIVMELE